MAKKSLTEQQEAVFEFIVEFMRDNNYPPTFREIGDGVGLANVNAVSGHVAALEKKGYIIRTPEKARSIQLVQKPSKLSRVKKRIHAVLGTDQGVLHQVVYGLAWATRGRDERLTGRAGDRVRRAFEREAVEHGWTVLDSRIEADHVVVVVKTWPNHSAERTVQRLRSAGEEAVRQVSGASGKKNLWGKGYVAVTDLDLLDEMVERLLAGDRV